MGKHYCFRVRQHLENPPCPSPSYAWAWSFWVMTCYFSRGLVAIFVYGVSLMRLMLPRKPSVFSLSFGTSLSLRPIRNGRSGPYDRKRFFIRCPFGNALL